MPLRLQRLTAFIEERKRLTPTAFLAAHPDPVLVHRLELDDEEPAFQTSVEIKPTRSSRPDMSTVVFPIKKRPGGAFRDRIGIGRAPNSDVTLPYAAVSKYHAYITQHPDGRFEIADAGSRNGTSVDGQRLEKRGKAEIADRTVIEIAHLQFVFYTAEGLREYVTALAFGSERPPP